MLKEKENGRIKLFIYDSNAKTYSIYNEITSDSISILPVKTDEVLKNYEPYTELINDNKITCYKISSSSKFCTLYAMDIATGEKDWYTYDLELKTIQRYTEDINNYNKEKEKDTSILIYILSGTTLLFGITTIAFAIRSARKRK